MSSDHSPIESILPSSVTPLDFSFKKLSYKEDLSKKRPRKNRLGKVPELGPNKKFITNAVWLGNNAIQTTEEASAILNFVLEFPTHLAWLDLSFNQVYDVDEPLLQFVNLKILYLHGNQIHNMSAVAVLRGLAQLRTVTLHGNPIETIPHYRSFVVNELPQLANLDFSPVLSSERNSIPLADLFDHLHSQKKQSKK